MKGEVEAVNSSLHEETSIFLFPHSKPYDDSHDIHQYHHIDLRERIFLHNSCNALHHITHQQDCNDRTMEGPDGISIR